MSHPCAIAALILALLAASCSDDPPDPSANPPTTASTAYTTSPIDPDLPWPARLGAVHQEWTVEILERLPHDVDAFTQGLEYGEDGLWESTGLYGESTLRLTDPSTGEVLLERALDEAHFGEGLTLVDGLPLQLTWRAGLAYYWAPSLDLAATEPYDGEGWGVCNTGDHVWMSDGSATLTQRDPETFDPLGTVDVHRDGDAIDRLNELECIGDHVVANVWQTDEIVVIDPASGTVQATIDASILSEEIDSNDGGAVLNGIADPGDGTLLLAGKLWPMHFIVRIVG